MMRFLLLLVFGITLFWYNLASADAWRQDTKLLPQYCKDRAKGINSAEFAKWRGTLGETFIHIHHYCSGIYAEQKARSTVDQQKRKRFLRTVKHEMQYVSRHCSKKCALYPELHNRWGWALVADGQPGEAIGHFNLAIQANPKYALAYARLSELFLDLNQPNEARRVLDEGLKAKPGSRMLQRRLRELESR
jgi:tetratricopeptide (TPR) repeat protein